MATSTVSPQPRISFAAFRRKFDPRSRQFRRHDLEEHRDLSRDVSVASAEIGGVKVDCCFHFSKTRLGILGDKAYPGGIIYMTLNIDQPQEWRLRECNVSVILEDVPDQHKGRSDKKSPQIQSVEFWEKCFGPNNLAGPELTTEVNKYWNVGPQAEVAGFGASLGDFGKEDTRPQTSWWSFKGTRKHGNSLSRQYTVLTWTMSQNALAYTTEHPPEIQTAFTFCHSYRPFLLRVEIDGKLRHLHHKYKDRTIGLFSKAKREKPMLLLFQFDPNVSYDAQLINQAKALEKEMNDLACQSKHVEVYQRNSSFNLLAQQDPAQGKQVNAGLHAPGTYQLSSPPSYSRLDQSDLTTRLQLAHNSMADDTIQPIPEVKMTAAETVNVPVAPVILKETSPEELAEVLKQMPAFLCWFTVLWIRIMRLLSRPPAVQKAM